MHAEMTQGGRLWRFGLVGVLNTLVDFGLFNLLVLLLTGPAGALILACNAFAFLGANLCSYVCNRSWTFARTAPPSLREYAAYFAISLIGLLLNSLVLWLLTGGSATSMLTLNLAKVGATLVSMGWNFFGYRMLLREE